METTGVEYTTEGINHLGIAAGICKQMSLIRISDESLSILFVTITRSSHVISSI
jgi:hypothetical protein